MYIFLRCPIGSYINEFSLTGLPFTLLFSFAPDNLKNRSSRYELKIETRVTRQKWYILLFHHYLFRIDSGKWSIECEVKFSFIFCLRSDAIRCIVLHYGNRTWFGVCFPDLDIWLGAMTIVFLSFLPKKFYQVHVILHLIKLLRKSHPITLLVMVPVAC